MGVLEVGPHPRFVPGTYLLGDELCQCDLLEPLRTVAQHGFQGVVGIEDHWIAVFDHECANWRILQYLDQGRELK